MRDDADRSPVLRARMGRAGRARGIVAVLAASAVIVGVLGAPPAEAAGLQHPRVIAVAASDSYLLYRQKTATAAGLSLTKGSTLYFIGRTGGRHLLRGFDPRLFPTLQGSTVTQSVAPNAKDGEDHDPTLPEHVRWRDLRTGATGVTEIPATDDYIGAAPGGWIAVRTTGTAPKHLVRYSTSGTAVDLGTPLVGSGLFAVAPGPSGVVAYSRNETDLDGTGLIRYRSYGATGSWRTVYAAGAGTDTFCRRPSSTHVVCEVGASTAKHAGTVLLPLSGTRRVWLSDHPTTCQVTGYTAVGTRAVGKATSTQRHCVAGRLTQLSASGAVTDSTRLWGLHASGITDDLGRILLDTSDQRRIVAISGVRGTPRTVVTAH